MFVIKKLKHAFLAQSIALALTCSGNALAAPQSIDIQAQDLTDALSVLGKQTGLQILYDVNLIKGEKSSAIKGVYEPSEVLKQLLDGKNVTFNISDDTITLVDKASLNNNGTLEKTTVTSGARFGDAPTETGGVKAEYQTTATKMAMPLKETPQAISVITRDSLDSRLVQDLSTAVELSAGVSTGSGAAGAPGMFGGYSWLSSGFSIRGRTAQIRTDGFENTGYSRDDDGVDMAAFERIEVVKGPAGFYGQGSLGGYINKVRKKPSEEFDAHISVQAGSYDTYRAEAGVTGSLNDDKTLRGRVDIAYSDAGSFTDKIKNNRVLFAPSIEGVINDKTRMLLQFIYQKNNYNAHPGTPTQVVDGKLVTFDEFSSRTELYGATGDKSTKELTSAALTINHELSDDWLLSLNLQADHQKRHHIDGNYTYVYGDYVYTGHYEDDAEGDDWSGELRLQGRFDAFNREHQVTFGIEANQRKWKRVDAYAYDYISTLEDYTGSISTYPFLSALEISGETPLDVTSKNKAVYAQVLLSLTDNTKLLIGSRYDTADDSLEYNGRTPVKSKDSELTSRLALIHTINDNVNAYAAYAESFTPTTRIDRNYNTLEPETGEGFEAGVKTEWFDSKLGVNMAIYRQDLNNRPIDDPTDRTNSFSVSSGVHRTDGVELEINGSPYQGWTISAAATWMDNEFIEEGDDYYGFSADTSVENKFSLHTNYEIQQGKLKGLSLGTTIISVGDQSYIYTDYLDGAISKQASIAGYHRLDFNFSYNEIENWDVSLLVRNVTDEYYIDNGNIYATFFGAPRSVLLEATYNFD
jgi:outer membrane receptor for ferric coprogen and ferric-rhodotorulic acid